MKILLVDNYDSFVYNIVGLLQRMRQIFPALEWEVVSNDKVDFQRLPEYDALILSPGPGLPSEAGELLSLIWKCRLSHPILGICLGCQAIAETFGSRLNQLSMPRHGHPSVLRDVDPEDPIVGFAAESNSQVGRYHSWVIDPASIAGTDFFITSRDEEGNIMSIRHAELPLFGLQFHPESIMTTDGAMMMKNFLAIVK